MKAAILNIVFSILCALIIAQGALQCFAPRKLKGIQDRLRPAGDWSNSAGGAWLEKLREKQASHPSILYRLSGFALLLVGLVMLCGVLGLLRR